MKKRQLVEQQLPDFSSMSSQNIENESILINGQKLLFDKKVKLLPVEVEIKSENDEKYGR